MEALEKQYWVTYVPVVVNMTASSPEEQMLDKPELAFQQSDYDLEPVSTAVENSKPEMENKRIQYSRDFLLSIQFMPDCMQKPEGLPSIPDVVLHKELFRTVRGFLNKLTPGMFNQLMKQVKELHIDTEERLKGDVHLIFENAIDEPNFSVGYGIMCKSLAAEAWHCVEELNQGGMLYVFVRVGVETTLERNQITRDHMGHLFHQLLQAGILSTSQFFKGRRRRGGRRLQRRQGKEQCRRVEVRVGTLNVGTMTGKGREVADMMERRKVDMLCVQETKWKGSKARNIGGGFKLFYHGVDGKRNGVGVILKEEYSKSVVEVKRGEFLVMIVKVEVEGMMINVISGYAPQVGCEMRWKERFWSELDDVVDGVPRKERLVIGADFNGHVGEGNRGDEEVMGRYGFKERNVEGQLVVDFAKRMKMAVVNTYFKKKEDHRVMMENGRGGIGYVTFSSPDETRVDIMEMNDRMFQLQILEKKTSSSGTGDSHHSLSDWTHRNYSDSISSVFYRDLHDLEQVIVLSEKRTPETEDILVQMVQKLEATLASERKDREQEINERNATHLQNITKLLSSLKLHEEQEKIVESERESWTREQKQLQEHVAQLEATLKREKGKKAKFDMEERNKLQLQTITELQDSLNYCKEERNTAKNEREILIRERRQLAEQVAQLEAVLKYERNYWEKKRKKVQRVMKTSNNLQLKTTRELQDSLNHSEEKKCADHESVHLRRDRERLEQRLAQLEATLNFEQNKFKKEKEMIKLDMEEMTTRHFQTIRELQDSLNHCEEEKNYLMRDRERLEERVAQLEETLEFVQNKFEKEKEKAKLDMEEMITLQRRTTRELQDSLNHCEEEKKTAKHERENLMRDRERLEKRVAQLEKTLELKQNKFEKEKEKAKLDMKEMITSQLQTTRDLQNSLIYCEEEKKIAKHERRRLDQNGFKENVAASVEDLVKSITEFRGQKGSLGTDFRVQTHVLILLLICPMSLLCTCPNHLNLTSLTLSPKRPTCTVPLINSFLILSIVVTPNEHLNIFSSANSSSTSCLLLNVTVSKPYILTLITSAVVPRSSNTSSPPPSPCLTSSLNLTLHSFLFHHLILLSVFTLLLFFFTSKTILQTTIRCCLATLSPAITLQSPISFRLHLLHRTSSTCVHLPPLLYITL
ncbi:eukaryotic translation initiation factor 4 gamma 3 isoform X8 [Silurus meridionalis]|nr:eukaryotic translation initiation factor 4 gamma 3 isoform X8 [Silurus meridionalis]